MIRIREDKPTKISGVTSLYLSFPFNEEAIKVIKTCTKYVFDKNTKCWELPINELAYLLDNLTYIDDITLELQNEDTTKTHFYPKLIDQYKTKPFKHQLEGIEYGLNIDSWLLLDDPGLGKTLQMIYLAEELKAQKGLEHCLIICGINSLKSNWEEEIRKHSNETVRILGKKVSKKGNISYGSIKERAAEIMKPFDSFFIITNIETLRSDEVVEALRKTKNKIGMVVLDEAHKCLAGNTLIDTDNGYLPIKDIVNNNLKCKIKSFNEELNKIEYKEIDSYYKSEEKETLIELTIQAENGKEISLRCTPDHPIYTKNRGYVKAEDLETTDILILD